MCRLTLGGILVVVLAGCGGVIDGPAPRLADPPAVDPGVVCTEQRSSWITVRGSGISPLPIHLLEAAPLLVLPQVALDRTQDLGGAPVAEPALVIADDPADAAASQVRWLDATALAFAVTPALELPPGLHTVRLTNANGQAGEWPDGLLAVPAPRALAVTPELLCADAAAAAVITGTTFLRVGAELPSVSAIPPEGTLATGVAPSALGQCRRLPGDLEVDACEELAFDLPAGLLPADEVARAYALVVHDPEPAGCASTETVLLTMVPAPTLAAVVPTLACVAQGATTLELSGAGFLVVEGVGPTVTIGAATFPASASACAAVTGPRGAVSSCMRLTVTMPADLAPGAWPVSVTNPTPAPCQSSNAVTLTVVPPPAVAAVTSDLVCVAQGDAGLTITGAGFLVVTGADAVPVGPVVSLGPLTLTPAWDGCTALTEAGGGVAVCTTLSVTVPAGSLAPGAHLLTVTNPSPAACVSPAPVTVTVAPPPAVAEVRPDLLCAAAAAREVVLSGAGFLVVAGVGPTVTLGGAAVVAAPGGCTPLTGAAAEAATCTTLTVTVPAGASPGLAALVVANPDPVGCAAAAANVYVAAAPTLAAVAPADVCTSQASTTLAFTGGGLLTVDGAGPALTIGGTVVAATASGCEAVAGLTEAVAVCSTLSATVAADTLAPGSHAVSATNPPPAGCASASGLTLATAPPPTVTGVVPAKLCAGGGTVTVTGTGFRAGATVALGGQLAASVVVASPTQLTAAFAGPGLTVGAGLPLTVANADGCSATQADAVTIVAAPQLFFADPPVAYNGFATRVTLYGAAITGPITSVAIRPSGTAVAPSPLSFTYDPLAPNRLSAVLPALPAGPAPGIYDVLLGDQTACEATLTAGLRVVDAVTLAVTAVTPPFGGPAGVTAVTVRADPSVGGGFKPVPRLYLTPQSGTQAAPLGAVVHLDPGRVTALVPAGLPVGGYDLIAVNPDGGVGLLLDAFTITTLPPPVITGLTPGSIPNQSGQAVTVSGADFRAPMVSLRCLDLAANAEVVRTPVVTAASATQVSLTVDASSFSMGALCVVRVVNDDDTYGDYASLVVTNLAQNLTAFKPGPGMMVARRALSAAAGQATPAARFIYAIGGDNGAVTGALASVEAAPVDIFGQPGAFASLRDGLTTARSFAGAATIGRCVYVAGGAAGSSFLATIERACILDPAARPAVVDLDLQVVTTGGLDAGLWYYQVAALRPASDPSNPGGETLPSEPFPVLLPAVAGKKIAVTPRWTPVAGATGYRVYRSPSAGAAADGLQLIAAVAAGATGFRDDGVAAQAARPLRLGATGTWHVVATLAAARQGAGVAAAPDPGDATGTAYWLYVMGGKDGPAHALVSYERLAITVNPDGSQLVGAFGTATATLGTARWQLGLYAVGNDNASFVTPPQRFLYAGGGVAANGTSMVGDVDAFEIQAGGALLARVAVDSMQPFRAGYGAAAANNFLFAFGGTQGNPNDTASSVKICAAAAGAACPGGPPALENWNNVSGHLTVPRVLMGTALQSGFIYLLGGQTDTAAASSSTELTIW